MKRRIPFTSPGARKPKTAVLNLAHLLRQSEAGRMGKVLQKIIHSRWCNVPSEERQ